MIYCFGVTILILAPSEGWLILAGCLGGTGGGLMGGDIDATAFTALITMWWESVPTNTRGKLYALEGLIYGSSRIFSSVLGGVLWDKGLKTWVLMMPILTEFLIVFPTFYNTPETLKTKTHPHV